MVPSKVVRTAEFRGTKRFELVSLLGSGGMGIVYEAIDRDHDTRVALKCLPSMTPDEIVLFKNEFRALQGIHHPNLITLHELFCEQGQWFFTMELVRGVDILSHVSGESPRFDEARLRFCYAQLARALLTLHEANKVHRDIKPSNVVVDASGRVVLLDFGLVIDLAGDTSWTRTQRAGTARYMAPEQRTSVRPTAAADWYSVGVLLYETLTGRPLGTSHDRPPSAASIFAGAPRDLSRLCDELLHPDPRHRATGQQALTVLSSTVLRVVEDPPPKPRGLVQAPLIGRANELARLRRGLDRTLDGKSSMIVIEGESGIGKSALVRGFLESLADESEPVLVLSGRCYEWESIPYKAFDGIMDGLTAHLTKLGDDDLSELVSRDIGAIARLFPVLAPIADRVATGEPEVEDPHVRRRHVFLALRQLLLKIARRQRVVVCIDDLQWADADSSALLHALVQPPGAPATLIVVVRRPSTDPLAAHSGEVELLSLANLSPADAVELASQLLEEAALPCEMPDYAAEVIAEEAKGHPLFIQELVHQVLAQGRLPDVVSLDEALWSRIHSLDDPSRRLVELVAVAGTPLPLAVVGQACAFGNVSAHGTLTGMVAQLRRDHLVRTTGNRASDSIEIYHDSIGRAVLAHLPTVERRRRHEWLARALELLTPSEPATLAVQWHGAGRVDKAATYALDAATQAAEALAFERAARLYRWTLELLPNHEDAPLIHEYLGDALANAGRGAESAASYLAAAAAGGPEQLDLERRAADQLFRSGYIDEGKEIIGRVLEGMGIAFPRTPRGGLFALLLRRLQVRLRGLEFRERSADPISPEDLARIDACWSVAVGLSMVDNIRGAYVQSRHLLLALEHGEPFRVLRALAAEACYVASPGQKTRPDVEKLLGLAKRIEQKVNDPYGTGFIALASGICAFLIGDWKGTLESCELAEWTFERRPKGALWELASARSFALWSRFYLGQYGALAARVPPLLREAEGRGDRYAATCQRTGLLNIAWLVEGDSLEARRNVLEAERQWSQDSFQFQHYLNALASSHIDLYEGNGSAAYDCIVGCWPRLKSSLYLRIQNLRLEALFLRARGAVAAAAANPSRRDLLADAQRCALRMLGEKTGWADPLAELVLAGVAFGRNRPDVARRHLQTARALADAAGMLMFKSAAAWREGELVGGEEGRELVGEAERSMKAERIKTPAHMVALLAPGFQPQTTLARPRFVLPPRP